MLQHIIVSIVFAVCLYLVVRRVARIISRAKRGEAKCDTCTETDCPLRQAGKNAQCECGCGCSSTSRTQRTPRQ
ncbi:MAG: hypothetical protein IKL03_01520 [Bacteroidaceae bacterium]|nr:hypothetical protein [Bacteroidaceae bacterium]